MGQHFDKVVLGFVLLGALVFAFGFVAGAFMGALATVVALGVI